MPTRYEPFVMFVFICGLAFIVLTWNTIYEYLCKLVAMWRSRAADVELIHEQYLKIHDLEIYNTALRHDLLLAYEIINKGKKPARMRLKLHRPVKLTEEEQAAIDALPDTLYEQSRDA